MFTVENYQELAILYRAVMETKFSSHPRDTVLPGSVVLADLSNKIVDSLIKLAEESGDLNTSLMWSDWRVAEKHTIELEVVKKHIEISRNWSDWSVKEKGEYVAILLSPFTYDEHFLASLVKYGDSCRER